MFSQILWSSLWGCSTPKHANPNASIVVEDNTVQQSELNGSLVEETIPAPDFMALNHDGTERSKADFLGKPTVIWFYPAANTPG
jgi:peroxiredoxin